MNAPRLKCRCQLVLLLSMVSWTALAGAETLRYSEKSTDEIVSRLESGNISEINDLLALGTRSDPRILPLLQKTAANYQIHTRRRLREYDPSGKSEAANDADFRSLERPFEIAAMKAAARLGDKNAFDYFVLGLSTSNGKFRIECMETLIYIGDRAAIKNLAPIIDDDGVPYKSDSHYKPPHFSDVAMSAIRKLMPANEVPEALRGDYVAAEWRIALKQWWKKNKSKYASLPFGKEKIFEVPVVQ